MIGPGLAAACSIAAQIETNPISSGMPLTRTAACSQYSRCRSVHMSGMLLGVADVSKTYCEPGLRHSAELSSGVGRKLCLLIKVVH